MIAFFVPKKRAKHKWKFVFNFSRLANLRLGQAILDIPNIDADSAICEMSVEISAFSFTFLQLI